MYQSLLARSGRLVISGAFTLHQRPQTSHAEVCHV